MNNRFTILSLLIGSTLAVAGCSNDSPFVDPGALADNELAPVSDVITQIPDQNSFDIAFEKLAVDALDRVGVTSTVTARVADRHNNPVPNNTAIRFLTNGGSIEPQCLTLDGTCTVTWTEQDPTPTTFKAIIIAYTTGEESFTDLNDNDMYDTGEIFTDIAEPFFDLNEDGIRDANTEEFIDADNDRTYDVVDGLFTGTPCVGDNTVCDRKTTLIWKSGFIVLSGSDANTSLDNALPGTVDTTIIMTLTVVDVNGNPMADGTKITLTPTGGSVDTSDFSPAPLETTSKFVYTSGSTAGTTDILKIDVETPTGDITSTLFTSTSLI